MGKKHAPSYADAASFLSRVNASILGGGKTPAGSGIHGALSQDFFEAANQLESIKAKHAAGFTETIERMKAETARMQADRASSAHASTVQATEAFARFSELARSTRAKLEASAKSRELADAANAVRPAGLASASKPTAPRAAPPEAKDGQEGDLGEQAYKDGYLQRAEPGQKLRLRRAFPTQSIAIEDIPVAVSLMNAAKMTLSDNPVRSLNPASPQDAFFSMVDKLNHCLSIGKLPAERFPALLAALGASPTQQAFGIHYTETLEELRPDVAKLMAERAAAPIPASPATRPTRN